MYSDEEFRRFYSYDKSRYRLIVTGASYQLSGDYRDEMTNEFVMTISLYDDVFITPYAQWRCLGVSDLTLRLGGGIDDLSAFSIERLENQWSDVRYKVLDAEQSQNYFFYCKDVELKFI